MQKNTPTKPGFVRVLITERNKTIQIRESHARNQKYLLKYGMVLIPKPEAPPVQATGTMQSFENHMTKNNPNALNDMADPESMYGGIPVDPTDANIASKPLAKSTASKPKSQPHGK